MRTLGILLLSATCLFGAERTVDPTFLHRFVPEVQARASDVTTETCRYKPIFGEGDSVTSIVKGVARFGEMIVEPNGVCRTVSYPSEEQIYFVLEGEGVLRYGEGQFPIRESDFLYLPPGAKHGLTNSSQKSCRVVVMGFNIPAGTETAPPPKLLIANADEVKKQTVAGHPPSVLYRLLMGDTASTRDRIAAGRVLTSLFIMDFEPGGTNFPHHHESEEEIYLILQGRGEIVAGGGLDGIEGRHPARAGDAYFFRLNCTVGFFSSTEPGPKARLLAVRSLFPRQGR
ncbi:MAG: cupin domain-containing protein [Acidobacteria bacterium]|nr:cupin domain-containing protein [Acidobacteriota bacterium]